MKNGEEKICMATCHSFLELLKPMPCQITLARGPVDKDRTCELGGHELSSGMLTPKKC